MRRYIDERDRLEREREEVRGSLGNLKKERREAREELSACQGAHTHTHTHFTPCSARDNKGDSDLDVTDGLSCRPQIPNSRPRWKPV